jgi:hypothetical protein
MVEQLYFGEKILKQSLGTVYNQLMYKSFPLALIKVGPISFVYIWCSAINSTTYCCLVVVLIFEPAHTQKTKIKWDTTDKDKYIELVNEGIQSSDLTLETAKDVEKAYICCLVVVLIFVISSLKSPPMIT